MRKRKMFFVGLRGFDNYEILEFSVWYILEIYEIFVEWI